MSIKLMGGKEHLNELVEIITDSCDKIRSRSNENDEEIKRINAAVTDMYINYANRWASLTKNQIKDIDIPQFMNK